MDLDRTRDVLAAFEREEVRYVIIGAVALDDGAFHVDRLTRLGEAHDFDDLESERVDFDGLEVTIATPRTLYRMKKATVRPQDWADAECLRQHFDRDND